MVLESKSANFLHLNIPSFSQLLVNKKLLIKYSKFDNEI